ncbi:MAG: RNA polymerase sigma factor [Candidatus Moraniibacteriota bacterium]|jgi:RNA polymerase sigma-70 factor, ECF subfamily
MNKKEIFGCDESVDDNEIVRMVQNGNTACFDVIIKRYEKKLFYYVMRFVNNSDESKDLVQNVFIKTLKHIDSFDCEKKFSSWIYRIAHNETMNWFNRSNKRKTISIEEVDSVKDNIEISDKTSTTLDEWFQIELRGELEDAVAQLPENYAQVITLRYFEDKSYTEISEILNKPTSSVGTLLRRAKKKLLLIVLESEKF